MHMQCVSGSRILHTHRCMHASTHTHAHTHAHARAHACMHIQEASLWHNSMTSDQNTTWVGNIAQRVHAWIHLCTHTHTHKHSLESCGWLHLVHTGAKRQPTEHASTYRWDCSLEELALLCTKLPFHFSVMRPEHISCMLLSSQHW